MPFEGVESPGGAYHPHLIEVQDFSLYGLVLDLRGAPEYTLDHVPGAVRSDAVSGHRVAEPEKAYAGGTPGWVQALLARVPAEERVLIYGDDGQRSREVADALKRAGREVDVMPGGWASYRRWVVGGLEVVPRLLLFRVLSSPLGGEVRAVLRCLEGEGEQVLDVAAIAGWQGQRLPSAQPPQQLFESELLNAMRQFDGTRPVYTVDVPEAMGSLRMPSALVDAVSIAPVAVLDVEPEARASRWRDEDPELAGRSDDEVAQLLVEVDRAHAARAAGRHALPPLKVDSFDEASLAKAVRRWLPR